MEQSPLDSLLSHLVDREEIMDGVSGYKRLKNALYELSEDDVERLVQGSAVAAAVQATDRESMRLNGELFIVSLLVIGVEVGRELERRTV